MSFTDLAKATGLSTSAAHQRVRRLEERGVLLGYQAVVVHGAGHSVQSRATSDAGRNAVAEFLTG